MLEWFTPRPYFWIPVYDLTSVVIMDGDIKPRWPVANPLLYYHLTCWRQQSMGLVASIHHSMVPLKSASCYSSHMYSTTTLLAFILSWWKPDTSAHWYKYLMLSCQWVHIIFYEKVSDFYSGATLNPIPYDSSDDNSRHIEKSPY